MCIEHANARQLHILNVQFWAWEKELESHRSTSHLCFVNYSRITLCWVKTCSDYWLSPGWFLWGNWLEVECSCILQAVVWWCVRAFWSCGGLGADIKQLCALWTWATSASWQTVMQSQQRCTHAIHAAYGHIVQSPENNNKKRDTHASLLAQGTLFWLYWSHTQAHPPPDWL